MPKFALFVCYRSPTRMQLLLARLFPRVALETSKLGATLRAKTANSALCVQPRRKAANSELRMHKPEVTHNSFAQDCSGNTTAASSSTNGGSLSSKRTRFFGLPRKSSSCSSSLPDVL